MSLYYPVDKRIMSEEKLHKFHADDMSLNRPTGGRVNMNYSAVCVAKDYKGGGYSQFMGRYESELILK